MGERDLQRSAELSETISYILASVRMLGDIADEDECALVVGSRPGRGKSSEYPYFANILGHPCGSGRGATVYEAVTNLRFFLYHSNKERFAKQQKALDLLFGARDVEKAGKP